MAERESDTARSSREETGRSGRGRSRRVGRGIATAVVGALLAYLIGVGMFSVVPQVFWPEHEALDESVTCTDGLLDLRSRLLARAGDRVAAGGGRDGAALRRWLRDWDDRHLALESRCTGAEQQRAWRLLGQLRQRVQATLERFDADEGELARDLDRTLARHGR